MLCVWHCRGVYYILLGVWEYGPQEILLLSIPYKVVFEAILDYLSGFVSTSMQVLVYFMYSETSVIRHLFIIQHSL